MRIIGTGRAGGAFALALESAGWRVDAVSHERLRSEVERPATGSSVDSTDGLAAGSTDGLSGPAGTSLTDLDGIDVLLLCVPDRAVGELAASISPTKSVVVAHCSGSLTLDVLNPAPRRASIHPLVPLADPVAGSRLLRGAYFAVAGDAIAATLVESLDGRPIVVAESQRPLHHAAAVMASNHVVALLAQVEAAAEQLGVPVDAYLQLARSAVENVASLGAANALTGPVSRGDWVTVKAHLDVLADSEREAYLALARRAAMLAGRDFPDL